MNEKKVSGAIKRLALLKTGLNGLSLILTPRLKNLNHRYLDRSSPLAQRLQQNQELIQANAIYADGEFEGRLSLKGKRFRARRINPVVTNPPNSKAT